MARIEKEYIVERLTKTFEESTAVFGMQNYNVDVSSHISCADYPNAPPC